MAKVRKFWEWPDIMAAVLFVAVLAFAFYVAFI